MSGHRRKHRVVVLCGASLAHRHTCATLIRHGLHVVGICEADRRSWGLPFAYVRLSFRKKGFGATLSRVAARLFYLALNRRRDRRIRERLFDRREIERTLAEWGGEVHRTAGYSRPETLSWLAAREPDVLVCHTPHWVGRKVRELPSTGLVLGGHPGLTPAYRGSHSAFWAIYRGRPEDVGCTVFLIDEGIDTGDVVAQERVPIAAGDSFVTLGWKGMIRIAELQAAALRELDEGRELRRRRVTAPEGSELDNPTLGQYLRYLRRRPGVR